ncbi:MAG: hypothetical protein KAJ01_06620, partial [Candidatus Hydrogenedentes bacterium]|nr:hypothetical protein [Candidatus Hydrogenedentota bacterium]
ERWALKTMGAAGPVYSIASRVTVQHPERSMLTLAGEIDGLRQAFGAENIKHNLKGIEGAVEEQEDEQ